MFCSAGKISAAKILLSLISFLFFLFSKFDFYSQNPRGGERFTCLVPLPPVLAPIHPMLQSPDRSHDVSISCFLSGWNSVDLAAYTDTTMRRIALK
jgi:hypothetical protein